MQRVIVDFAFSGKSPTLETGEQDMCGIGMKRYGCPPHGGMDNILRSQLRRSQDKLIPVNPSRVPKLDESLLEQLPSGYRYLAYCQEKTMGVKVLRDMPGHVRENFVESGNRACGEKHNLLYWQCKRWIEEEEIEV